MHMKQLYISISAVRLGTYLATFEVQRRYKRRNRIERLFGRLKDWRRVATRYDRSPTVFLSAIVLAATVIFWLRVLSLSLFVKRCLTQTGFTGERKAWKVSHYKRKFREPFFDRSAGARSAFGV